MRTAIATAAILALAACGSERTVDFETEDGGDGSYTVDTTTGEASGTITTDDGTVSFRSGADAPVDLPGDFTVYPGANVVSNTSVDRAAAGGGGQGTMLILQTDDPAGDVIAHYRRQAEAEGVEIQMEMTTAQGKMIAGESPDGMTFSVNANEADGKTTAQLTVAEGMQ